MGVLRDVWTVTIKCVHDLLEGGLALTLPEILKAKDLDHRAELFSRAIKAGADIQTANRKLLLRLRLCAFPLALLISG